MTMFQEVQLSVSNLTSEVRSLAHLMGNCYACLEAWLLARLGISVACTKLDVLRHSDK